MDIAGMLLDAGVDPTISDNDGKTPSQVAAENKNHETAILLQRAERNYRQQNNRDIRSLQ